MVAALDVARLALAAGEVPIGAVVLDPSGTVIASAHNEREALRDPTAHAEVVALRKAGAVGSLWDVVRDRRLNHRPEVVAGVRGSECAQLVAAFFADRR